MGRSNGRDYARRSLKQKRPGLDYELKWIRSGYSAVAGLDEAGRGAWAGPVVAAAVILNLSVAAGLRKVNDSKQLTPRQREALYPLIVEASLAHAVGLADSTEIDAIGIVPATRLAMRRALDALTLPADALIIDAVKLREVDLPQSVFNFADSISLSVAAASILAKVTRDRMMVDLAARFPEYGFERHKGYGTRAHQAALQAIGPSCAHRRTFKPIRAWLCHDRIYSATPSG